MCKAGITRPFKCCGVGTVGVILFTSVRGNQHSNNVISFAGMIGVIILMVMMLSRQGSSNSGFEDFNVINLISNDFKVIFCTFSKEIGRYVLYYLEPKYP